MGLAAQQARLLTITGRQSSCMGSLMSLSHDKEVLARDKDIMFGEYQNSLNQTKLIYDYYGTGDQSQQLNYGLMMSPTLLNNYAPIILTDMKNRSVLSSKYASAARAAGIPQEGFGTLPSDKMRNNFFTALWQNQLLGVEQMYQIMDVPYNQKAGMGLYDMYTFDTEIFTHEVDYADLLKDIKERCTSAVNGTMLNCGIITTPRTQYLWNDGNNTAYIQNKAFSLVGGNYFTLSDLLSGTTQYTLKGTKNPSQEDDIASMNNILLGSFINWVSFQFANLFDSGDRDASSSLAYTAETLKELLCSASITYSEKKEDHFKPTGGFPTVSTIEANKTAADYLGITKTATTTELNLNNIAQAFLALYTKGPDNKTTDVLNIKAGAIADNKFVTATNPADGTWTVFDGKTVNKTQDTTRLSNAYDALFNYICANGWTENNEVTDNEYLQRMMENGMFFISSQEDDGRYHQGRYATDKYIQVVQDDEAIARAEAKYNSEKLKLNQKEQILDLKMKNLDSEISALTTEYDSVKSTISKNVEKVFKRYG